MKRFIYFISIVTLASIILSACAGDAEPSATALPAVTEPPAATEAPAATEPPLAVEPVATIRTIDLAGPLMELGSKYLYVDGTTLVAVPGGPFIMGYNSADNPVHEVTLSDFWIYSTKVTNSQYALCVQTGKCSPPDPVNSPTYNNYRYINFPVTGVNYGQGAEYCAYVHGRLPTEAEWEKTARGPDGNLFPWGDNGPACNLLNYKFCEGKTTAVNDYTKGVSYYGAFDMSGNAREHAADWYSPTYYTESAALLKDPLGPAFGEKRSVRGSSYQDSADPSISAHRFSLKPTENLPDLGFRCIVEDPTYFAPLCTQLAFIGTGPNGEEANCTPQVACNDVDITQGENCSGDPAWQKFTIVTFDLADYPPNSWSYSVPGCPAVPGAQVLVGGNVVKDKLQCDSPGPFTAHVEGSCTDTASCVSACPANYDKVGDLCQWNGSGAIGTECIAGTTYDPVNQCCSATPGTGADFDLCPAGFYPVDGACYANPPKIEETIVQDVTFIDVCSPPVHDDTTGDDDCGPNDPNYPTCLTPVACTLSANSCSKGGAFDLGKCCCRYLLAAAGGPFACP